MITIACVLRSISGNKVGYDATWVDKLHRSVDKYLTIPYKFVCLSDCEVSCERVELEPIGAGWWAKMQLFRPNIFDGPVLFFDLDTVIFGDLTPIVEALLAQEKFIMWRDPTINISSSAIMYWNGDYSSIYETYKNSNNHYENKYSSWNQNGSKQIGDQALISELIPHAFINDLIPPEWIQLVSKKDNVKDFSKSKILIFKKPHSKPSTLTEHPIVKQHWK
jgi:hypothetical protein